MGNAAGSEGANTPARGTAKGSATSTSPFTQKEVQALMKRYAAYDPSEKGREGISTVECVRLPELMGNKMAASLLQQQQDQATRRIHPAGFLKVLSALSSKTPVTDKKKYLFQLADVYESGVLTHDELFRVYKLLLKGAVSDDHILDLTFRALRHPDLATPGQVTQEEFFKMIPDHEIKSRLTVDFLPAGKT